MYSTLSSFSLSLSLLFQYIMLSYLLYKYNGDFFYCFAGFVPTNICHRLIPTLINHSLSGWIYERISFIFLKKGSHIHTEDTGKNTNINISFISGPGFHKSVHVSMASVLFFFFGWYLYEMHAARHSQVWTVIIENDEHTKAKCVTVCLMYRHNGILMKKCFRFNISKAI